MTRLTTGPLYMPSHEAYVQDVRADRSEQPRSAHASVQVDENKIRERDPDFDTKRVFALVAKDPQQTRWERVDLEYVPRYSGPSQGRSQVDVHNGSFRFADPTEFEAARRNGVAFGIEGTNGNTYWLQDYGQNYGIYHSPRG